MIEYIKQFIVVLIVIIIIDIPVISQLMKPSWKKMIEDIQITPFTVKTYPIIVVYILMVLGIVRYVLPYISDTHIIRDSFIYGGLLGLIIYGIFDFTNYSLISKYDLNLAIIDTLWGCMLFTFTTYLSKKILLKLRDIV
jgi:uncharacterized membrane protein